MSAIKSSAGVSANKSSAGVSANKSSAGVSAPARTPGTASPWERWGWLFASIWLVFLVYPIVEATQVDLPVAAQGLSIACTLAFGVVNILGYSLWRHRPWIVFAAMLALAGATIPVIGIEAVGFTPYLGMISALTIPRLWWPWTTAFAALLPLASLFAGDDFPTWFFLMVWPIILGGVLIRLFVDKEIEAEAARNEFALVAERERVARDVHDVLGHSLTALSVKAELAARLIDVDPDRAREELLSIQETARQALAEVRNTVGGLRAGNLEAEVASAPRILRDAGVEVIVEGSVADTDPRHRALLAWALREAVTNVVRHAGASSARIALSQHGLVVTDNGRGFSGASDGFVGGSDGSFKGSTEGNGLRGMRERVSAAGGRLSVSEASPGTRLEVSLP